MAYPEDDVDPYAEDVDQSVMDDVEEGVDNMPNDVSWDTKVSELT